MSTNDTRAAFEAWQREQQGWLYTAEAEVGTFQEERWIAWQAATEAAKATGTACTTCKGTGLVDDGEINHYLNGEPYMCGPVKCVKDCPDCTPAARQPAPVADQLELICARFGWRTDGDSNVLADRIEHHIRDLKAGIKARDAVIAERDAALAAAAAPAVMPEGVTIKAFQAAHDKAWHITIKHPFGTSSVRMSDQRDIQLAELIAATNRSQP